MTKSNVCDEIANSLINTELITGSVVGAVEVLAIAVGTVVAAIYAVDINYWNN